MKQTYAVQGMHCSSCVDKVVAALRQARDVESASVSLNPPRAVVEGRGPLQLSALRGAVATAGPYTLEALDGERARAVDQELEVRGGASSAATRASLYPLVLIVAYLAGAVLLIEAAAGTFDAHRAMRHFMAGFFLVFSFFKLLDLHGFARVYRSYDIVARRAPSWALVYPFVELGLGLAYLWGGRLALVHVVTLAVMVVGSIGVLQALLQKRAIRCACLGTVLNLPMTTVTLVEDLGMAAMALGMLLLEASSRHP
jgi:copper chaperone CopZ